MNAIQIAGLTRDYGQDKGVFDLSFEVGEGEVFGFLGPNGAGKTTTIRPLDGLCPSKIRQLYDCRVGLLETGRDHPEAAGLHFWRNFFF